MDDPLTPKQRQAIALVYLARMRYPEVAERMGVSVGKVRRLVFDGMRIMGRDPR